MEGESLSIIHEAISMLRVIVAFGREDHEYRRFREQGERAVDARVKRHRAADAVLAGGEHRPRPSAPALVLGFGAYQVLEGTLDRRPAAGRDGLHRRGLQAARDDQHHDRLAAGACSSRCEMAFELLDTEPEIQDAPDAVRHRPRARRRSRSRTSASTTEAASTR